MQWLLQDSELAPRLYATVDSVAILPDSVRRRLVIFTRYDVLDSKGMRVTEARMRVTVHHDKDTVLFESAVVNAFRTMSNARIDGEVYGYIGAVKYDSAKADSGRRFTQSLRRRFNLNFDSTAGPLVYINAAGEQTLQRLFGFAFLRDTIAGLTLQTAHVIFSADTGQGEAHLHERVHAALVTSNRATQVSTAWEESFAGYLGGWRGSPWQVNACEQMRMYGLEIPADPAKFLSIDSTTWRVPERVRSTTVAISRIRNAAQAAFLSVVSARGGDAALDSVMFAGPRTSYAQLQEIAQRVTKLGAMEFAAVWRAELIAAMSRCPVRR
jgi:hypothetical protein